MRKTSKKSFKEKRKSQRINIPIKIKYKLSTKKRILHETISQDISGSGMKLHLSGPLEKGDILKAFLYFPQDVNPVGAVTKVIRCRRMFDGKKNPYFEIGARHVSINQKDRMRFVFLFCEAMLNYFVLGGEK